jgi:proteasome accessory factor C
VLIELFIEDDQVSITLPQAFDRPLSLTPEQGLALVTAGAMLLATPGADPDGPLARGLAKLSSVLDIGGASAVEVRLGEVSEDVLTVLREALSEHRQVKLDYYAYGRDELTQRVVDPHRVTTDQGQWYLSAFCHLADDDRLFRIDRIRAAELLDTTFQPPPKSAAGESDLATFSPAADDPRVTIDFSPQSHWVVEQYPVDQVADLEDGAFRVTMAVTARQWLERLLLRLGPEATVVDGPEELRLAGRVASARILDRYLRSDSSPADHHA